MSYVCEHCGNVRDGDPAAEQRYRGAQGEIIRVPLCGDCATPTGMQI